MQDTHGGTGPHRVQEQGKRDQVHTRILLMQLFCRTWRKPDTNLRALLLCEATQGLCEPHEITFNRKGSIIGPRSEAEGPSDAAESSLSIMAGWDRC